MNTEQVQSSLHHFTFISKKVYISMATTGT